MTRITLLARCSAAAAVATLIAGLAAAPAIARPDPGGSAPEQSQLEDGSTKAQIEHGDQLWLNDGRTKAQIEHSEQLSVPSTGSDDVAASSDEFPWATVSFAAVGLAAVAAGGMVVLRQRRTTLVSA